MYEYLSMDKKNKFILTFIIKGLIVYLIWFFVYENWLMNKGVIDEIIIDHIVLVAKEILDLLGFETFIYEHVIGIQGSHGVFIGTPCNGIELMALFMGFILVFPGSWKTKSWYIPLGLLIIHILNLIRVVSLTVMAKFYPEYLDFNHKYTFTITLYAIVFYGWILWVKQFANIENNTKK